MPGNISGAGRFANISVISDSIPDNGMYLSASNTLAFANGGVKALSFGASQIAEFAGAIAATGKASTYNAIATAGWGTPAVYGNGRTVATSGARAAAAASYTVGAADGTFEVSANVLVTTSTTHSFSMDVSYTDEGNSARTLILPMTQLAGTLLADALITNTTGAGPYHSPVLLIRCKAATAITIRASAGGTYTTVVYNTEGVITQVA